MILVYLELPPKWIISIFSAATLPFSFKFITAPFIEKYTFLSYGKRKTWIIISQIICSILLLVASFLTDEDHEVPLAILFIFTIFFLTLQGISLDAVAIKELKIPTLTALIQGITKTVGLVVGGLCFLKATSAEFAEQIGLSGPMTTPAVMLRVVCGLIFIPTVLIHFGYSERILDSERTVWEKSMLEIVGYYR
jgi:MFS family permease